MNKESNFLALWFWWGLVLVVGAELFVNVVLTGFGFRWLSCVLVSGVIGSILIKAIGSK